MDRLDRALACCGLAALLSAAPGCRGTKSEVPPGRPYGADGRQLPPVGFSTEPHPAFGAPGQPGIPSLTTPGGTAASGMANYGTPTGNAYGPPGSSVGGGSIGAQETAPRLAAPPQEAPPEVPPIESPSAVPSMGDPGAAPSPF